MKAYEFWTHNKFMDVFVEVLKVQFKRPDYWRVKVRWWNKSQTNNPYCLNITETIRIDRKDLLDWKLIVRGV